MNGRDTMASYSILEYRTEFSEEVWRRLCASVEALRICMGKKIVGSREEEGVEFALRQDGSNEVIRLSISSKFVFVDGCDVMKSVFLPILAYATNQDSSIYIDGGDLECLDIGTWSTIEGFREYVWNYYELTTEERDAAKTL